MSKRRWLVYEVYEAIKNKSDDISLMLELVEDFPGLFFIQPEKWIEYIDNMSASELNNLILNGKNNLENSESPIKKESKKKKSEKETENKKPKEPVHEGPPLLSKEELEAQEAKKKKTSKTDIAKMIHESDERADEIIRKEIEELL